MPQVYRKIFSPVSHHTMGHQGEVHARRACTDLIAKLETRGIKSYLVEERSAKRSPKGTGPEGRVRLGDEWIPTKYHVVVRWKDACLVQDIDMPTGHQDSGCDNDLVIRTPSVGHQLMAELEELEKTASDASTTPGTLSDVVKMFVEVQAAVNGIGARIESAVIQAEERLANE